jgi:LPPG:FO 2-phospho-L-lactate transferase
VAVSPFVGGEVLKGPTLEFCRWAGIEPRGDGLTEAYAGLLDGIVADELVEGLPCLVTGTLMDTPEARARVAAETLDFAGSLRAT